MDRFKTKILLLQEQVAATSKAHKMLMQRDTTVHIQQSEDTAHRVESQKK